MFSLIGTRGLLIFVVPCLVHSAFVIPGGGKHSPSTAFRTESAVVGITQSRRWSPWSMATMTSTMRLFLLDNGDIRDHLVSHSSSTAPPSLVPTSSFSAHHDLLTSSPTLLYVSDAMDIVKNIFIALGVILGLVFGFVILFSSVVIPAAAKQLEDQTKQNFPELWDEVADQLTPGQTLQSRPDLMELLGTKYQARIMQAIDEAQRQAETALGEEEQRWEQKQERASINLKANNVIDVEVEKSKED